MYNKCKYLMPMTAILILIVAMGCSKKAAPVQNSDFAIQPPAEKTTIDVIGWSFPITEFYKTRFEALNAIDNLSVNVQYLNNSSAQEQVRLALSGGNESPYEIVHAANAQISEWGYPGWLTPLNDLIEKYRAEYDLDDIPQTAWDAATIDGKIYGVPCVSNSFQMIYRADLFEKYNINVPKTWDEVIEAANKLKDEPSIDIPFIMNLHAGWAWEIEFFQMQGSFGGKLLNVDGTPAFNGPKGVKALETIKRIADVMGPEGLAYSIDDLEIGLQTGRVAFATTWASRAVDMNNPEVSDFADELKFAPSPSPTPGGTLSASAWNDFYSIPTKTKVDKELIFQVIMETLKLENQKDAIEFGVPTRTRALESDKARDYMAAAMQGISRGVGAYPVVQSLSLVRSSLAEALPLTASDDNLTPQEILDRAAENYLEEAKASGFIK